MPIPVNLKQLGEKQGFEDGWRDAMNDLPNNPCADGGYGLIDVRYEQAYAESYKDGYTTGTKERIRREKLMARRKQQQEQEAYNDLIPEMDDDE